MTSWSHADRAELWFSAAGLICLLALLRHLARHGGIRAFLTLPALSHGLRAVEVAFPGAGEVPRELNPTATPAPSSRRAFSAADAVAPLLCMLLAPSLLSAIVPGLGERQPDGRLSPAAMVVLNSLGQAVVLCLVLWIARRVIAPNWNDWGCRRPRLSEDLTWGILGYLATWPLVVAAATSCMAIITLLNPGFEPPHHTTIRLLTDAASPRWLRFLAWTGAVAAAPIVEELYFRGILLNAIAGAAGSRWTGIVASACIFGMIHAETAHYVPALILFGVVLGFVYAKSRSLPAVMLLHGLFNLKTLLFLQFFGGDLLPGGAAE